MKKICFENIFTVVFYETYFLSFCKAACHAYLDAEKNEKYLAHIFQDK